MTTPIWERGVEGGRTRPINRARLGEMLVEIRFVLELVGIRFCLLFGSCLGAYRDGGIIPWDDDADLGVFMPDRGKLPPVLAELAARGYTVLPPGDPRRPVGPENMPYYDTVFIKYGEKVELWWFEQGPDYYVYDEPRCGKKVRYARRFFDSFNWVKFLGGTWPVPAFTPDWLAQTYGSNWRRPIKGRKPLSH